MSPSTGLSTHVSIRSTRFCPLRMPSSLTLVGVVNEIMVFLAPRTVSALAVGVPAHRSLHEAVRRHPDLRQPPVNRRPHIAFNGRGHRVLTHHVPGVCPA